VGNNTQDTASENQDSFEETPQVSASQTSTEKMLFHLHMVPYRERGSVCKTYLKLSQGCVKKTRVFCKSRKKMNLTLLADLWPLDLKNYH